MSGVGILHPVGVSTITASVNAADAPMVLTASPREVWAGTEIAVNFDFDLGEGGVHDAIYIGAASLPTNSIVSSWATASLGGAPVIGTTISAPAFLASAAGRTKQQLLVRDGPLAARYLRVRIELPASAEFEIGLVMVGQLITHPYAYGPGRQLIDTTRRTDMIDGGFGIDPGVSKSSFRWRFIDLDDAKREAIWACAFERGIRRTTVVAENVDALSDASVHYGLFDRFEAWERANAVDTQWVLSMTEWR